MIWPSGPDQDQVDLLLAAIDDSGPTAVHELDRGVRVFFTSGVERDTAMRVIAAHDASLVLSPADIADEAWAERSQAALRAITVGVITIAPPWDVLVNAGHTVVIQPSMGFGTGHHASTRLCLRLLQDVGVSGQHVLDVGTGSGVLAIAAATLGAASVVAIDCDEDALTSARESAALNQAGALVGFRACDLASPPVDLALQRFDALLANLTGAVLARHADRLAGWLAPAGTIIASGITGDEADEVTSAFARTGLTVTARIDEDEWVGMAWRRRG